MATKKGSAKAKAKGTKAKQPQLAEVRDAVHSVVLNTTAALGEKLDKVKTGVARVEEQIETLSRRVEEVTVDVNRGEDRILKGQATIIEILKGLPELVQSLGVALAPAQNVGAAPAPAKPEGEVIDVRTSRGMTLVGEPEPEVLKLGFWKW